MFGRSAMTEFELKFEVTPANLTSVAAAVKEGKVTRQRLQASYFDTADGTLARHGIVVRLRKEGRRWVQTAKGPTADLLARLEHNAGVSLPGRGRAGAVPTLDLARHRGTPVGEAIDTALRLNADASYPSLTLLYGTDIKRITTRITVNSSVVEVALDQGHVFANSPAQPESQAVCELEFELMEGAPLDAVALARQWCATHGLSISTIAKSMKGQRLQQAVSYGAATSAVAPGYSQDAGSNDMLTAVVATCLSQILPNMSELAGGSGSGSGGGSEQPDHIHQLRVGIRRLRTALRELGDLTDAIDPQCEAALVSAFRALGAHRDQSNLALSLQPQLLAAGGPGLHMPATDGNQIASQDIVRAADFQDALLGLIAFLHRDVMALPDDSEPVKKTISRRLNKLYKKAMRDGKKFMNLEEQEQHSVRKRLKSLRYLIEFTQPLFAARKVDRMITALKPVQDALGLYNDELMALHAWRVLAEADPKAWFGIGWLTARKPLNAEHCWKEIKALADIKPFWRN